MQVQQFEDFDAFATSISNVESRMMFRNPNRRVWRLAKLDVDRMIVQHGQLGSGNIAQGQIENDGYMLYLPLTPATEYVANGVRLAEDSFIILEPGSEFCVSTKAAHDWGVVFVPVGELATKGGCVGPSQNVETPSVQVTPANRPAADRFRSVFFNIMTAGAASPQFESSPAASAAAAELLAIASSILGYRRRPDEPHAVGRPRLPREEVIRRCQETLEHRKGRPVSVNELAEVAGVSGATLRSVFHEFFGIGPLRYLHLRQLHQINRSLQAAGLESTVSEILVENGVWEFGRFARRYRQLFGELPSETLRSRDR